jgi:hypothetical protein
MVLDISGGKANGDIILWPEHGGANQKWHFDEDMTIRNELGNVLDVRHGSRDNNAPIVAFGKHGQGNQKFRIVPVPE